MMGGEFATARRGIDPASLRYAHSIVQKSGYQAASLATGIAVADLKAHLLPPPPRKSYTPVERPVPCLEDALRNAAKALVREIPKDRAHTLIDEAYSDPPPRESARVVARETAALYGLTLEELIGPSRKRHLAWPRQHIMWALKKRCPHLSDLAIARLLGRKDHTTVWHGIRAHEKRMAEGRA